MADFFDIHLTPEQFQELLRGLIGDGLIRVQAKYFFYPEIKYPAPPVTDSGFPGTISVKDPNPESRSFVIVSGRGYGKLLEPGMEQGSPWPRSRPMELILEDYRADFEFLSLEDALNIPPVQIKTEHCQQNTANNQGQRISKIISSHRQGDKNGQ